MVWGDGPTMVFFLPVDILFSGFPGGASGKEPACQCTHKRHRFDPWVGKILLNGTWQPTPEFLPGESHGQRSLARYSPQGQRQWDTTEPLRRLLCAFGLPFLSFFSPVLSWIHDPYSSCLKSKDTWPVTRVDLRCAAYSFGPFILKHDHHYSVS